MSQPQAIQPARGRFGDSGVSASDGAIIAARPADGSRLHFLDTIRAAAMLLGIPFHAALIYAAGPGWFVSSDVSHIFYSYLGGLVSGVRMPLFFCVAGMLSAIVLAERDAAAWLRRRLFRLGLPLIAATLVIGPLVMLAKASIDPSPGVIDRWVSLVLQPGEDWIGHLWFLQVLLGCSVLAAALAHFGTRRAGETNSLGFLQFVTPTVGFFIAASFAVSLWRLGVNGLFYVGETRFGLGGWVHEMVRAEALLEYTPYFLLGLIIAGRPVRKSGLTPLAWALFAACGAIYAVVWNTPEVPARMLKYAVLGPFSVLGSVLILDLLRGIISERSDVTDYFVRASYNVYLFHYPIVVGLGVMFLRVDLPIHLEFLTIVAVTFLATLVIDAIIRRTALLELLFNGVLQEKRFSNN
ncbi:acyltransferase family protein [Erythrobacter rubeus]|uniref:Acyltransferase family protein n=1 Tax=Erythrobacter rubeus TaxID=2760803 RepID=A0ABR8KXJ9_9SPHN|nr:acyltransferase family protein [Erythrobacter rubeus]MBD2842952.1 acyltransferase family protein [Erythrobacter rubeus]